MRAIGLMSGTSLDGVDAALVNIIPHEQSYRLELLRFEMHSFKADLREALYNVLPPNVGSVASVARLHNALGLAYGCAAQTIAGGERIDFVASHGQTIFHDGYAHVTLQLGDPFVIRELIDATVCYDFRSADCAAGGHGAPLVARVDSLLLGSAEEDRVAVNLGGIANITILRKGGSPDEAIAFDTGPANILLDAFVRERTDGAQSLDRNGALAARGRVDEGLLRAMLLDDYFGAPPPKTTGRERFGAHFLARFQPALLRLSIEDGAATITDLTAASVSQAIVGLGLGDCHVIVSGGGARNPTLLARIAARLEHARVEVSDPMGINADAKEAIAFAVLGYETLRGRPGNVPSATGARHPVALGAIAPRSLSELVARIENECRNSS